MSLNEALDAAREASAAMQRVFPIAMASKERVQEVGDIVDARRQTAQEAKALVQELADHLAEMHLMTTKLDKLLGAHSQTERMIVGGLKDVRANLDNIDENSREANTRLQHAVDETEASKTMKPLLTRTAEAITFMDARATEEQSAIEPLKTARENLQQFQTQFIGSVAAFSQLRQNFNTAFDTAEDFEGAVRGTDSVISAVAYQAFISRDTINSSIIPRLSQ